jgi:hypothetical protein
MQRAPTRRPFPFIPQELHHAIRRGVLAALLLQFFSAPGTERGKQFLQRFAERA